MSSAVATAHPSLQCVHCSIGLYLISKFDLDFKTSRVPLVVIFAVSYQLVRPAWSCDHDPGTRLAGSFWALVHFVSRLSAEGDFGSCQVEHLVEN